MRVKIGEIGRVMEKGFTAFMTRVYIQSSTLQTGMQRTSGIRVPGRMEGGVRSRTTWIRRKWKRAEGLTGKSDKGQETRNDKRKGQRLAWVRETRHDKGRQG